MRSFARKFHLEPTTRVLDVGGTLFNWTLIPTRPEVLFVNVNIPQGTDAARCIVADACALPFKDQSFDIVYSNSLVEHLGSDIRQQLFAEEVQRVGHSYYVQTPNRWFPVEPHLLTMFIHWGPARMRNRLWRWFSFRGVMAPQECRDIMKSLHLLTVSEMRVMFPDAKIWRERFFGLCKSIIMVKLPENSEMRGSAEDL